LTYGEVAGKTVQYMFDDLFKDYMELKAETLSSSCFIGDGKGGFQREELPQPLQLAPIFSFTSFKYGSENKFLGAGNFYGVLPYEGRYDAMPPTVFSYQKQFNVQSDLPDIGAEIRDMSVIKYFDGTRVLVIAANNHQLIFLKI